MINKREGNEIEKYYTPPELIKELFILRDKYCNVEITEYLENSAGGGAIIDFFDKPYLAYDIKPEPHRTDIKEGDYLKELIPYKEGRVCMMNPPFHKALKFLYKALKEADWCFCIMPPNSVMNIDYDKYWVEEIQFWDKYPFYDGPIPVLLMAVRLKKEGDKYEYEV